MKNRKLLLMVVIFASAITTWSYLNSGLPNENRIYPYNTDELTYISRLTNLNLDKFDFDPKVYWKVHFPVYYAGAVLKLGNILGLYEIGNKDFYKAHPDQFTSIIKFLRICWGKFPLLFLIFLSFFIGKKLIDENFGILFSAVIGFLPTFLVNSNYAVENILIVLEMVLVFYYSILFYEKDKLKYLIWASLFAGLAVSTKQTGILSFIFIGGVIFLKKEQLFKGKNLIKYLLVLCFFPILAFAITSPYYLKFIILKLFSPDSISPDVYGNTTLPTNDIFRFNIDFLFWNIVRIIRVNFVQLGGLFFLLVPIGIFAKRMDNRFRVVILYIIAFYSISSFSQFASDSRLTPLAYFLALFGAVGCRFIYYKLKNRNIRILLISILVISFLTFSGTALKGFISKDNREISSDWIEKNILLANEEVTIGLHKTPWHGHPDIITSEWMHNKYPKDSFYPNHYGEIFVIPDFSLSQYGGEQILPKSRLETLEEKMTWVSDQNPQYIILMHEVEHWVTYFNKNEKYELIKHFPKYNFLGISNLTIYSFDSYIYKLKTF